jgi:metal-responsive CopG/Arc/MetJ family transcriptional regulator
MAPNQRDENKRIFSVSFEKTLLARIESACAELGTNRVAFLKDAATEKLAAMDKEKRKKEN